MTIPATQPMVSLGVMCGDEHAGKPLERCLRSVLEKKAGCPVDEIVVGFNGNDVPQLRGTLQKLGYWPPGVEEVLEDNGRRIETWFQPKTFSRPPLKVVIFKWPARFDVARNQYWAHLTGEWLLSIDADDILADAGTEEGLKALQDIERDYGLGHGIDPAAPKPLGVPVNLQDWLKSLPQQINVIYTAYDYAIDPNGYVLQRQKVKRLVRKNVGHLWYSPDESGIHEVLTPVGAVTENAIANLGILMRHYPSEADAERANRNVAIVQQLTKSDITTDSRHAFDSANAMVHLGDLDKADKMLLIAVQQAQNDMDRYTYRLAYASLQMLKGRAAQALETAFACVGLQPDFQESYFIACDALYAMGKWGGVVEWYERGLSKQPMLLSRDQPLMRFIQPRGQAAISYLNMNKPIEALKLAQECIDRYPKSPLAQSVFQRARDAAMIERSHNYLLDAVELLMEDAPTFARIILEELPHYAATRGLMKGLRVRTLQKKLDVLPSGHLIPMLPEDAQWEGPNRIELQDALDAAYAERKQLLEYQQLSRRAAKVRSRKSSAPSVAFYCPAAVEKWQPEDLTRKGLGGSESSVAYLARELGKRGHHVEVYTPHTGGEGVKLWTGEHRGEQFSVLQKDFTFVWEASKCDIIVTCRSPYLAREMADVWGKDRRIFCWHQDNGYGNPWLWSAEVAAIQQHLHVSEWARGGLIAESMKASFDITKPVTVEERALVQSTQHHVLGNGVPQECLDDWGKNERKPHRIIYASDPTRGLEELLKVWPQVREAVPDAELFIYSAYLVMLTLKQEEPGMSTLKRVEKIMQDCSAQSTNGVNFVGWLPQMKVLDEMKKSGIYAYPGGKMPEGFGVSLVQAEACGCEVVCSQSGALPEVLKAPTTWSAHELVKALQQPRSDDKRRTVAEATFARHNWSVVADRFLSIVRSAQ